MKCRTVLQLRGAPDGIVPAGTIIEAPDCYRLVLLGAAEPADDECREKVNLPEDVLQIRQKARRRIEAGIQPEDNERFDRGEIVGYNPDGSDIPGPNYQEEAEDEEDE